MRSVFFIFFLSFSALSLQAQKINRSNVWVYVDKDGVLRWTKGNAEAAFFGVNYTAPFAYSYRAHKALGVDIEQAIRQDVYHLARLGLDAFRVHVWDTEISDSLGNLLENDHLRLFDFLLSELKKRNIRVIITPIAFWGNGYPQADERTPGFSRVFGKGRATANDTAIRAQENYLHQFFKHVNPYTKLSYTDDPGVIAVELNNEPSHSGPKAGVTAYINRLAAAVRSDGWAKPLFYNISQSPYYADAVAASDVNGFSFQWYPSGLVAGYEQKGNFLPNVDGYPIPFDTIPAYRKKARMVYEFESADVLQSYMYPAMARSFRGAGFQWATQFAYDPLALAYANTEYQTHYLNLAYTPGKAISILIASRVFHELPRGARSAGYPADSVFGGGVRGGDFRVSYKNELSEMNSGKEFYYTNTTETKPVDIAALRHIAGVGSSPVLHYGGTGAYFLDRVGEGLWRLEVMPDAVTVRDPFGKPAPDREVVRIQWESEPMSILLPGLGDGFTVRGLNTGNDHKTVATGGRFFVEPGTYLVSAAGAESGLGAEDAVSKGSAAITIGGLGMDEVVAPKPVVTTPFVVHEPSAEVSAGKPFVIRTKIVGIDAGDKVVLYVSRLGGGFPGRGGFGGGRAIVMKGETPYDYSAEIPAELAEPGVLEYRIVIHRASGGGESGEWIAFPGDHHGDPSAWDYINNDNWQTIVAAADAGLEIFNPGVDRAVNVYPPFRRGFQSRLVSGPDPGRLILRLEEHTAPGGRRGGDPEDHLLGFQYFFGDKRKGREGEAFDRLVIRARVGDEGPVKAKVTLTNGDGASFSAWVTLDNKFNQIEVPLKDMRPDSVLLLPRPYPGFQRLWFKSEGEAAGFRLADAERIQVTLDGGVLEVAAISLQRK
jgi:hypothetical protein